MCIRDRETTLVDRIAEPRLNWFGHVSRMGSERLPAKALHCSYINGKRNQGRQPKKWMDNVNEDIEAKKLTVQQAMVLVWDRNKWKHRVAASSSLKWWKRAERERERESSAVTVLQVDLAAVYHDTVSRSTGRPLLPMLSTTAAAAAAAAVVEMEKHRWRPAGVSTAIVDD